MVHSNISWHIFEYVSNRSQFFIRNKNENFKPRLLQFQVTVVTDSKIGSLCVYLKKHFHNNFDSCLECKSVSYTMVYIPCFQEVYLNIRNQSGCLCYKSVTSQFLGLEGTPSQNKDEHTSTIICKSCTFLPAEMGDVFKYKTIVTTVKKFLILQDC